MAFLKDTKIDCISRMHRWSKPIFLMLVKKLKVALTVFGWPRSKMGMTF